jgi:ABC-2 type transport system permease protein
LEANGRSSKFYELLSNSNNDTAKVSIAEKDDAKLKKDGIWFGILWVFALFSVITMFIAMGIASLLFEDRQGGTLGRIQISNATSVQYIVGVSASALVLGLIVLAIPIFAMFALGLGGEFPIGIIALLALADVFFIVGLSLVCGLYSNSRNMLVGVAITASTVLNLIGGAWFPLDFAPEFMQKIALFTPQYWFMTPLWDMSKGMDVNYMLSLGIITLFALLCFLLAGIRFASNRKNNS